MKKMLIILVLIQTIFMLSCSTNSDDDIDIVIDDLITMENLDDYMFKDDYQYIDLRNFDARFNSGFIYSFEVIPFFEYLDNRAFVRNNTFEFDSSQLIDENQLLQYFDSNKTILLYADGCIRSGYIKDALNHLGYKNVYVLGGFFEYDGENKVLGDGHYSFGTTFSNSYHDEDAKLTYYIYGNLNMDQSITNVRFDIIDVNNISLRTQNYDVLIDYNSQLTTLEEYILSERTTFYKLNDSLSNPLSSGYDSIADFDLNIYDILLNLIEAFVPE